MDLGLGGRGYLLTGASRGLGFAAAQALVDIVDAAPGEQDVPWRHRHLLDVDTLSAADLRLVLRTTDAMREVLNRPITKVPALRGRNVTILFYEASTRTRVSFEVARGEVSRAVVERGRFLSRL